MSGDRRLPWCAIAWAGSISGDRRLCSKAYTAYLAIVLKDRHVLEHARNLLSDVAFRGAQAREARVASGVFTSAGVR